MQSLFQLVPGWRSGEDKSRGLGGAEVDKPLVWDKSREDWLQMAELNPSLPRRSQSLSLSLSLIFWVSLCMNTVRSTNITQIV